MIIIPTDMSKNVIITGGTRGIGAACTEIFVKNGYNVYAIYSNDEKSAMEISDKFGCKIYKADVSDRVAIRKVISEIINDAGQIDVLVNNAGVAGQKLFIDLEDSEWDKIININLSGIYNVTKEVLKNMISNNSGSIVNISSIWGQCGASCEVHYSASKAGVIGLTKALAKEVARSGIRVNCVAPGFIETDMNSAFSKEDISDICEDIPMARMGTGEECAELIYFIASNKASYITGQTIGINGGWEV